FWPISCNILKASIGYCSAKCCDLAHSNAILEYWPGLVCRLPCAAGRTTMFRRRFPRQRPPRPHRVHHLVIVVPLLATGLLAACSGPTIAGSSATATISGSPTPTPVTCAQKLPSVGKANAGSAFADLPLPSAVGTSPTKTVGGGDGQFTLSDMTLCSESTSAARLRTFFNALPDHQWLHSNYFPADAEAESPCGDEFCWAKDTRYVRLEQVTDQGGGVVTYHLRFATPPSAPDCSGGYNGIAFQAGYYYFLFSEPAYPGITDGFDHIALPPLTQLAFAN